MGEDLLLWSNEQSFLDEHECLAAIIKEHIKSDKLKITASKVNWKGEAGHKIIDLTNTDDYIYIDVVPCYPCTFKLYKGEEGLYATVSSHDIPTGSHWSFKEYKEDN